MQPWLQPGVVHIYYTGCKFPDQGPPLLLCRLKLCVSGNGSFRPQEAGQCPYWKLGFYHRRMLQANWAAIEIAFEAMFLFFFWLYSTAQMHKPIFQCFLLFFFHFWNSSNKNWLLLLLHHPLPWHYSIAFLHPQFILGGENNSPVLTHVIGNQ